MADILARIRTTLDTLRKSEHKVARCVLDSPESIISMTITDFADRADTSEPTVIRFCRKLGLSGFMELKLSLARQLPTSYGIVENVNDTDSLPQIFNKMFQSAKDAIDTTMNRLDMQVLAQVVEVMAVAGRIEFYGFGGSGTVAADAHHKFFRLGRPCIAYSDAHMQVMSASLLTAKDVVVAISHTGSSIDLLESVRVAKKAGATIVGIVGHEKTPLNKLCDYSLSTHSQEVALKLAPMATRLAQLAILDVLFVAMAMKDADGTEEKLEKTKTSLTEKRY